MAITAPSTASDPAVCRDHGPVVDPWPSEPERLASLETLMDQAKELRGVINTTEAELAALTSQIIELHGSPNGGPRRPDDQKLSHSQGFRSLNHEFAHELGLSPTEARNLLTVAEQRTRFPLLTQAADDGRISTRVAALISAVATPETEPTLVELINIATVAQIQRVCAGYKQATNPNPTNNDDEHLHLSRRENGWALNGFLNATDGETLRKALEAKRDELFRNTGKPATNLDALRAIIETGPAQSGADQYLTLINVDLAAYTTNKPDAAHIVDGPPLTNDELARILEDCSAVVVVNHNGHPVWVSDKSRTPPPWMRRLLRARDNTCAVAGCHTNGYLEAHHLTPYATNPTTHYENLRLLCGFHHRLLHTNNLTITTTTNDELLLHTPTGKPLANPHTAGPTKPNPNNLTNRTSRYPGQTRQGYDPLTHYGLDTLVGHLTHLNNNPATTNTGAAPTANTKNTNTKNTNAKTADNAPHHHPSKQPQPEPPADEPDEPRASEPHDPPRS